MKQYCGSHLSSGYAKLMNTLHYKSDSNFDPLFEVQRLNFFIGKNNSGKSRFLRFLFSFQPVLDIKKVSFDFHKIKAEINSLDDIFSIDDKCKNADIIENITRIKKYFEEKVDWDYYDENLFSELEFLKNRINRQGGPEISKKDFVILNEIISLEAQNFYPINKFYIPILRGMRPIQDINTMSYLNRTKQDYFKEIKKLEDTQIITGENLYKTLQEQLLGKAREWKLVREYEKKLSQYFF